MVGQGGSGATGCAGPGVADVPGLACLSLASAVACISGENVGWLDIGVANADCPDMVVWLITQGVGVGVATPLTFVLFPQAITATTSTIHSMTRMHHGFMTSSLAILDRIVFD